VEDDGAGQHQREEKQRERLDGRDFPGGTNPDGRARRIAEEPLPRAADAASIDACPAFRALCGTPVPIGIQGDAVQPRVAPDLKSLWGVGTHAGNLSVLNVHANW